MVKNPPSKNLSKMQSSQSLYAANSNAAAVLRARASQSNFGESITAEELESMATARAQLARGEVISRMLDERERAGAADARPQSMYSSVQGSYQPYVPSISSTIYPFQPTLAGVRAFSPAASPVSTPASPVNTAEVLAQWKTSNQEVADCQYCKIRKIHCSGIRQGYGRCSNCERFELRCTPASVPSQAQPFFPTQGPSTPASLSLYERYTEEVGKKAGESLLPKEFFGNNYPGLDFLNQKVGEEYKLKSPGAYTKPFLEFMTNNPTVFHACTYFEEKLASAGFTKLSERKQWNDQLKKGGKYFINRNGSSLIAFTIGKEYKSGNGVAMVAGHIDALTARLKPISTKNTKAGYVQLGIAPYSGGLNETWWDRDLGIAGRVLVKDSTGKIVTKLVKLDWPIAKIPTLAPHFGVGMTGKGNTETELVPVIGLDNSDILSTTAEFGNLTLGGVGSFAATQPPKLVKAIAGELSITDYSTIINWELELFDTNPAQVIGLEKEFISAGRIDDKVCSWAAMEGLLAATAVAPEDDGIVKLVGVFDDEEIGSLLRQGARGNFLPSVIERITETFAPEGLTGPNLLSQTYANSFLVSADVTHAANPNFLHLYLENHAPRLNVGLCVAADSNGHMTTDSISTALLTRTAEKSGNTLQVFMIRNDSRSGGTVGPMLSSAMGVRAIDAGIPQLSMHSIRATIGCLDPGLGAAAFAGFFCEFEAVDKEFE